MGLFHNRKPDPDEVSRGASKSRKAKRDAKRETRIDDTVRERTREDRERWHEDNGGAE